MLKATFKVTLILSRDFIETTNDVQEVTYISTAKDRETALFLAYQEARDIYYGFIVISSRIEPLFN